MNLHKPFFSVVIPLYNKEACIGVTLESVLTQSYKEFEVLIVNDGSTDKSLDIIQLYQDYRIKLFCKENGGASSARNFGINQAQGSYVAFLDADDTWAPDYLLKVKELIRLYPGGGLYISAYYVKEETKEYPNGADLPEGIINDFFRAELNNYIIRISASVIPYEVLLKTGGFPVGMISGEDAYLCALIAIHHKVVYLPQLLVTYNSVFSGVDLRYDKVDTCKESWFDFYEEGNYYKNEFIAVKAIKAGIRSALGFCKERSTKLERATSFTKFARKEWLYLYILNRLPDFAIRFYKQARQYYKRLKTTPVTYS